MCWLLEASCSSHCNRLMQQCNCTCSGCSKRIDGKYAVSIDIKCDAARRIHKHVYCGAQGTLSGRFAVKDVSVSAAMSTVQNLNLA